MEREEEALSQILRDSVPEPPGQLSMQSVLRRRTVRLRRRGAILVAAALTAVAAVGVPMGLGLGDDPRADKRPTAEPPDGRPDPGTDRAGEVVRAPGFGDEPNGVGYLLPEGWRSQELDTCDLPLDKRVAVGDEDPTADCVFPPYESPPTYVWLRTGESWGLWARIPAEATYKVRQGQPTWQWETEHEEGFHVITVWLPWYDAAVDVAAPDLADAKRMLKRITIDRPDVDRGLRVPDDAMVISLGSRGDEGDPMYGAIGGDMPARVIAALRDLEPYDRPRRECREPWNDAMAARGVFLGDLVDGLRTEELGKLEIRMGRCNEVTTGNGVAAVASQELLDVLSELELR